MLRAVPDLDAPAVACLVEAAPADGQRSESAGLARRPIRTPDDYGVPLPEWLQRSIEHVPPGEGESCPIDA